MTSVYKPDPGGCGGRGGWVLSRFCGGCGGCYGLFDVFPTIFVLYLNDLSSEALSLTSLISFL